MTTASVTTRTRETSHSTTGHQREVANRLRKVGGQLNGVHSMYENGRYCLDVLDQLSAVTAATDAVALLILEDHIRGCLRVAIDRDDRDDRDEKVEEVVAVVSRYVRGRGGRR
ncbi:MAG TPA: metal-sensitive transcriptional regulator [Nakamurella multipartita]|mgnify:FL=1|nr:metal-sensitive transcriptional regulator [Nakamurella multipartita]